MPLPIRKSKNGIRFPVTLQPRSSRNEITGWHNEALKIKLTAPPVEGAANQGCIKFLAKWLQVPVSRITIVSGASSRNKTIQVDEMDAATFTQKINSLIISKDRQG